MLSANRFIACGRGSTTLAEAIAIINPTNPNTCHQGNAVRKGSCAGIGVTSGKGVTKTIVGETMISVAVFVGVKVTVAVVVGVGVNETVPVAITGIAITPDALPHRS